MGEEWGGEGIGGGGEERAGEGRGGVGEGWEVKSWRRVNESSCPSPGVCNFTKLLSETPLCPLLLPEGALPPVGC